MFLINLRHRTAQPRFTRSQTTLNPADYDVNPTSVNNIGPLSAFTAESVDILMEAQARIDEGRDLRLKARLLMRECIENARNTGQTVNESFVIKIEETLLLSV